MKNLEKQWHNSTFIPVRSITPFLYLLLSLLGSGPGSNKIFQSQIQSQFHSYITKICEYLMYIRYMLRPWSSHCLPADPPALSLHDGSCPQRWSWKGAESEQSAAVWRENLFAPFYNKLPTWGISRYGNFLALFS